MRGTARRGAVDLSRLLFFVQHPLSAFSCLGRQRRFGISRLRIRARGEEGAVYSRVRKSSQCFHSASKVVGVA